MKFYWKLNQINNLLASYFTLRFIIYILVSLFLLVFPITTAFLLLNIENNLLYNLIMFVISIGSLLGFYKLYQKKYEKPPLYLILSINIFIIFGVTLLLFSIYLYRENLRVLTTGFVTSTLGLLITILGILYTFISDNFSRLQKHKKDVMLIEQTKIEYLYRHHKKIQQPKYRKSTRKKNSRVTRK